MARQFGYYKALFQQHGNIPVLLILQDKPNCLYLFFAQSVTHYQSLITCMIELDTKVCLVDILYFF